MTESRLAQVKAILRQGDIAAGWATLHSIRDDEPQAAELWYLRSVSAQQIGNVSDAQASVERALVLDARQAYFHLQAARLAADRSDHLTAVARFQGALSLQPQLALAWSGLGSSYLALGRRQEARQALQQAASASPPSRYALHDLARLELAEERLDEALALAQLAAAPPEGIPDAMLLVGDIHHQRKEGEKALAAYRTADAANPTDPRGALAAAMELWQLGKWAEAKQGYGAAWRRHPSCVRAALGTGLTIPYVYSSFDQLMACRQQYEAALAHLAQLSPGPFCKPTREFLQDIRWSNFLLAYQGMNDAVLQSTFGDLIHALTQSAVPQWLTLPERTRGKGGKVRIGFASHFFYDCTAGRYFSPWVLGIDRNRYDVFVYYTNSRVSPNTQAIMGSATAVHHMPSAPVIAIAERIREDALEILVYPEIGMYPDTQALASLRLAPVQCAAWGHPTTTGLPTIDWFISCETMEPEGAQAHYRERLALLPGLGTAYPRPEEPAPASRADLGLPEGKTLYLIPQSAFKIHPDNDELIASVLAADRNGVGVLFAADATPIIDALVRRLKPVFERHGLSTRHDLVFLPSVAHDVYLAVNRHCDVMLDTLHWSGGNTALDALSVGLPIVTLPGALMRGRQSSAMLRILGVEELIVSDSEAYVRTAVRLGTDAAWRESLRARILDGLPKLFDDPAPIAALNDLLFKLAQEPMAKPLEEGSGGGEPVVTRGS